MAIKNLFVTEIWESRLSPSISQRLNRELRSDIRGMMTIDEEGWKWSETNYPGGYTSYASITQAHERFAPFTELKKHVDKQVRKYIRKLEWDLAGRELKMTTCWVNVMPPLVQHSLHLHPHSVISGTYYVSVPKGSGQIRFEDPRMGLFMAAPPRKPNARSDHQNFHRITPKAGDLLLWESWLRHEVTPHLGSRERISISFNYG